MFMLCSNIRLQLSSAGGVPSKISVTRIQRKLRILGCDVQGVAATTYPSNLLNALRHELASVISDSSANVVPSLCAAIGLSAGDTEESFRSKTKYAERRLFEKSGVELIAVANKLLERSESFDLLEAKSKVEEYGKPKVSELTRRRIVAIFNSRPIVTDLDYMDFLQRVWPMKDMPTLHGVFRNDQTTLYDDFVQAIVRNDDWPNQEVLENLNIYGCSQRLFFRFLEEVVSPMARDHEGQIALAELINDLLQHDGYRLTVVRRMSGSPVYEVRAALIGSPADTAISATLLAFDPETVHARWTEALDRRDSNPEGAITLARTLLEDVCKWITIEAGEDYEEKDELPHLYRRLAKILKLAPDDHTEQIFKQILGNCQSVVESLGALRNKISDAHSRGPKRVKPAPRHAQLAVNLSGAMADFLVLTWLARKDENKKGD